MALVDWCHKIIHDEINNLCNVSVILTGNGTLFLLLIYPPFIVYFSYFIIDLKLINLTQRLKDLSGKDGGNVRWVLKSPPESRQTVYRNITLKVGNF